MIHIGMHSFEDRISILKVLTADLPLSSDVNLADVARKTSGESGADLKERVRRAYFSAVSRNKALVIINQHDFEVS